MSTCKTYLSMFKEMQDEHSYSQTKAVRNKPSNEIQLALSLQAETSKQNHYVKHLYKYACYH